MTRLNRVGPDGAFAAVPARGTMLGNRGVLHGTDGRMTEARWRHRAWVCCVLRFRGRRRTIMAPGRYTELFFLDEAVALAAGHRPCGECRRDAYRLWAEAWARAHGAWPGPRTADAALHAARAVRGGRRLRTWRAAAEALPDGTFVRMPGRAHGAALLRGGGALPFGWDGYGPRCPRPAGPVEVLTPEPAVAVLRAGYRAGLHASAGVSDGA